MRSVRFRNKETGDVLHHVVSGDDDAIAVNTPAGHEAVDAATESTVAPTEQRAAMDLAHTTMVQIQRLEQQQHRAVREFLLGRGGADRLAELDQQIAALRARL